MKKEIVVATAVTALLTSLSAENNIVKLNADSSGKIIISKDLKGKDIKGKIDTNKQVGKGDDKKWSGFLCGNNHCAGKKKIGKDIKKVDKIGKDIKKVDKIGKDIKKVDINHNFNQRP